jgi:hypothetical protein
VIRHSWLGVVVLVALRAERGFASVVVVVVVVVAVMGLGGGGDCWMRRRS